MKAFIDRIFKSKKLKEDLRVEENKRLLAEQIEASIEKANEELRAVQNDATQAAVEAIIEEVKQEQEEFPNFVDSNKKD